MQHDAVDLDRKRSLFQQGKKASFWARSAKYYYAEKTKRKIFNGEDEKG